MDKIKTQLKKYYDSNVNERDTNTKQLWKCDIRDKFLSVMKEKYCESLLEIGAGTGQDSLFFMENGLEITAVDLSSEHIKRCKDKGLNAYVMDFSDLKFDDNTYDAVYTMNCLLHIPNDEILQVLHELKRVIKPNGHLLTCQYGNKTDDDEETKSDIGKGERFFSFRTFDSFSKIVKETDFIIVELGIIEIGEENYNVQYFVLEKE